MGQKVHPKSLRIGYIYDWDSKWISIRNMPDYIEQDYKIRSFINKRYRMAGISSVVIQRAGELVSVNINTARPGIVIGKRGVDVELLRVMIEKLTKQKTSVNISEVKNVELDAQLIATNIALQVEKKVSYKKAINKSIEKVMKLGAKGIKIMVSGRLGGAEIARTEWIREGRVPLQTFRADVKYGFSEAFTTYGQIGVKVWIFYKEIFENEEILNKSNKVFKRG